MPINPTRTRKHIGAIIASDIDDNLDDETLSTQIALLEQLKNKKKLNKQMSAKYNYLTQLQLDRNSVWRDVKSPRNRTSKRITYGKDKSKVFFKNLPVSIMKPKLKRLHTIGGKRKTVKKRK